MRYREKQNKELRKVAKKVAEKYGTTEDDVWLMWKAIWATVYGQVLNCRGWKDIRINYFCTFRTMPIEKREIIFNDLARRKFIKEEHRAYYVHNRKPEDVEVN